MIRRLLVCAAATPPLFVASSGTAWADNCGTITDCFSGGRGILLALAAVLVIAGLAAVTFGGAGLLAGLFGGLFEGGALAAAGGGVIASAGAISTTAAATAAAAGTAAIASGIVLAEAAENTGGGTTGSSSSGESSSGRTNPSRSPDPDTQPGGRPTRVRPQDDAATQRSITRENESAQTLARKGYDVEQNPPPRPNGKRPDYKIEGEYFDNYAPDTSRVRNAWDQVRAKVEDDQADRIILNLDDSPLTEEALREQFTRWPISGLREVITIRNGVVTPFFP